MKITESTIADYSFTLLEEFGLTLAKVSAWFILFWFGSYVVAYTLLHFITENINKICAL